MKLSCDDNGQPSLPVSDWSPVDFITELPVVSPAAKPEKKNEPLFKEFQENQTHLVKVPASETLRAKKITGEKEDQNVIFSWEPFDFRAEVPKEEAVEVADTPATEEVKEEETPAISEEALQRFAEMQEEIERKLAEADARLEQAHQQAEEMLAQAQTQTTQMVQQAQSQVDQIKQQAFDEGALAIRLQSEEQMHRIATIIEETHTWRKEILEQSEVSIIKMLQIIAKKLFGNGFVLEPSDIEQMVGRAVTEANRLGNLRVYINPEDHNLLLSLWQESDLVVNGQKILLIPSQNILRGGCFVEGEFGVVDSRIDVQLELLESELNHTLNTREQEKQRQLVIHDKLPLAVEENTDLPQVNLQALDEPSLNIGMDTPVVEEQQSEEYGPEEAS